MTFTEMIFLHVDSGTDDPDRLLIFTTRQLLDILRDSTELFGDGTFKMAPEHFEQIYVLRTPYDGISVTGIVVEHANDLIYLKNV